MTKSCRVVLLFMLFALVSVILTACGSGGGGGDDGNSSNSAVTPILGTWSTTVSNCTETLTFSNDKTFKSNSYLEIQTGIYELTKKNNNEYTLSMTIQNDNGGLSCPEFVGGGNAENDTGSQITTNATITDTQLTFTNGGISLTYQK